jgi:uncharacterized protein (TIGR02757 family)
MSDQLKRFLDEKVELYNNIVFIENDPICIPHQFSQKEDIEISGFLTALISWGRRHMIIDSANKLMELMHHSPYNFVMTAGEKELKQVNGCIYRTFNSDDFLFLIYALRNLYQTIGGLEQAAAKGLNKTGNIKDAITEIRTLLLKTPHLKRSEKHLANPEAGSAAKRINMFFRWMVRQDEEGVDFGIWKRIPPGKLMCPLDVHSGRTARKLGLLSRKQNDWKATEELTATLRKFDPDDPVKYDFALFGMGVFEQNLNS